MSYFTLDRHHERAAEISFRFAWMTPELAQKILNENNRDNRGIKKPFVRKLTRDIQAGHWQLTHQSIAFAADGQLLDGQNRLLAIIASGVPVLIGVAYNVPQPTQKCMDSGSPRNRAERIKFGFKLDVDSDDASIATAMIGRGKAVDVSDTDLHAFLKDHFEAIRFARTAYPKRWGSSYSALYAVLARAYYHVEAPKIIRFCHVMNLEPYEPSEQAAAKWAKELSGFKGKMPALECFERTQRSLTSFLGGDPKGIIKPDARNLFPLPGEDESDAFVASGASGGMAHHAKSNGQANRLVGIV